MPRIFAVDFVGTVALARTPAAPTPPVTPPATPPAPLPLVRPSNIKYRPEDGYTGPSGGCTFTLGTDGLRPTVVRSLWLPRGTDVNTAGETLFNSGAPQIDIAPAPDPTQVYATAPPDSVPDGDYDLALVSAYDQAA